MKPDPENNNIGKLDEIIKKHEELIQDQQIQIKKQDIKIQQLESINNLIPGAFFQFKADKEGRFYMDYLSKSAENIFNKPISDLLDPDKMLDDIHPDDKEGFISSIQTSLSELTLWDHIYRVKSNRDDSYIWIHGKSMPKKGKDETIVWDGLLLDTTNQKNIEQEVINQKKEYELLVNEMIDAYASHKIICDNYENAIDYKTLKINAAYENHLNIKSEDIVGKLASEILPEPELKKWLKIFGPVALKGETTKYTIYSEQNDKYFEGTTFSSRHGYFEVVFKDVTNQKKHENELIEAKEKAEESEKRFRTIAEHTTEGITVADLDGNYVFVNNAFCKMSGYSKEELLKMTVFDMGSKQVKQDDGAYFRKENVSGQKRNVVLQRKDGTDYYTEITGTFIEINKQKLILGSIKDISEIVKYQNDLITAKEKAEESDSRLRLATTSGKLGVWDWNIQEDILIWNERMFELYGADKDSFTGSVGDWGRGIHPEDKKRTNEEVEMALSGAREYNTTFRVIRPDNTVIHIKADGIIIRDENQKPVRMIGINRDISDIVKYEDKLIEAKEKAEDADRLKSAFLANMSHEIRTPMNGILGFTNLLKEPELTGADQQKYIEIIQKSGERMLNTVNDIVEISKIDAGQVSTNYLELNISNHLITLKDFFSLEAEKKGLKLLVENKLSEEESLIKTDKNKVSSVLSNLLKNAIKFTEQGIIKVGCEKKGDWIEIQVSDTGIGIPEKRREAIFNRFEQGDIKSSRLFEGSGLGLSIAKSYIEMLGGKIWVESKENNGSIFYFTIPYYKEQQKFVMSEKIKEGNENVPKANKMKILIAEDDEVSRMHLEVILKDVAQEMIFVDTGKKVIDSLQKNPDINIILMDVRMAGMDGLEATRKIREFNKDVVIIAQTAFALEGDRQKALNAGCNDYISKPFFKKDILLLIEKFKAILSD